MLGISAKTSADMKRILLQACGLMLLMTAAAVPARAVVVQELSIKPYQVVPISVTGFYTGTVLAGINHLLVDGVGTNAFCIDPFHFSIPFSNDYAYTPLANAPKPPGTMGTVKADQISRLWAMAYSPVMTAPQAAGFQLAIWQIVGGSLFSFSGSDYGASVLLANLANFNGPGASLIGLTGPGQDYVIQDLSPRIAAVPETGATVSLLMAAVFAILLIERHCRTFVPAKVKVRSRF